MKNDIMTTAKLTSKGQITIPKVVREKLELKEGDSVIFYMDENNDVKISNIKDCKIRTDSKKQVVVKRGNKDE